jgi:hypothetical protein
MKMKLTAAAAISFIFIIEPLLSRAWGGPRALHNKLPSFERLCPDGNAKDFIPRCIAAYCHRLNGEYLDHLED